MKEKQNQAKADRITIKKLIEQRDEARQALADERSNPLIGQLIADKQAQGNLIGDLTSQLKDQHGLEVKQMNVLNEIAASKSYVDRLKAEHEVQLWDAVARFNALKGELVDLRSMMEASFATDAARLEALKKEFKVDDVKVLKKRLHAKSEELSAQTELTRQFKVKLQAAEESLKDARAALSLVPDDMRQALLASVRQ